MFKLRTFDAEERMRLWRFRTGSILRRFFIGLVILSIISCWILVYHASKDLKAVKRAPVFTEEKCYQRRTSSTVHLGSPELYELGNNISHKLEKRLLVAIRKTSITFRAEIAAELEANRFPHQFVYLEPGDKTVIPELTNLGVGKFSAVIFESIKFYLALGKVNKQLIDDYCRKFAIGIILFSEQEVYEPDIHAFKEFHLAIKTGVDNLQDVELNPKACLLRLTRAGGIIEKPTSSKWNVFFPNHSTYEAVEFATLEVTTTTLHLDNHEDNFLNEKVTRTRYTTVLADLGLVDGIRRVYFGSGLSFWLHKLLFIDSLSFVSRGQFAPSLERKIVVDIDDIFVGRPGIRMTKEDVQVVAYIYFIANISFILH